MCNIAESSLCDMCNMHVESVQHLFWECSITQMFWSTFKQFTNEISFNADINYEVISFGIPDNQNKYTIFNFLVILAKYFIFKNKLNKSAPKFELFTKYVKDRKEVERIIALSKNKLQLHNQKWNKMTTLF